MTDRGDDMDGQFAGFENETDARNGKGAKEKESKLSHVPCKFYKVGGCTAGNNCPFSHSGIERGAPKETCQWFVKGNCKFGHKCALAHLLPGQPIAMDRKNKKAAQQSTQTNGNNRNGNDGGNKNNRRGKAAVDGAANGRDRDRLADNKGDRFSSKPTGNLTATAPTLSNASEKAPGDGPGVSSPLTSDPTPTAAAPPQDVFAHGPPAETYPSPRAGQTQPALPKRYSSGRPASSDLGYGPIGSPPSTAPIAGGAGGVGARPPFTPNARENHFSPGTSPHSHHQLPPSSSPFTHGEGKQQFFGRAPTDRPEQSPIAIQHSRWQAQPLTEKNENAIGSDEDDYEDFVPSSLNDLLTPEERQRRLSRSGGTRNAIGIGADNSVGNIGLGAMGSLGMGNHRYSRSVPAARLLEAASAWKDVDRDPSSISVSSLSYRSNGMSDGFSPTQMHLATSNASGAFLHGYARNPANTASNLGRPIVSQSFEETDVLGAVPTLASRAGGRYESPYSIQASNRVVQLGGDVLSPTSRALQAHAPGQSLPQGLAVGLSRLHLGQSNGHKLPGSSVMGMGMGGASGNDQPNPAMIGIGKTGVRSPLRSQFLGAAGTPPSESRLSFGLSTLSALSSSPGGPNAVRPSWAQQHSSNGLMAPPPPKIGVGLSGSLGVGGVGSGAGATVTTQKPAHDAEDIFALDV